MHVKPASNEPVDHMLNLGVRGALLHDNYHERVLFPSSICIGCLGLLWPNYSLELSSGSMAARSAERASSMMRSNRRRIAPSVSGPGFECSAFCKTSFS